MTSPLHNDIIGVAGANPALFLKGPLIVNLVTKRLTDALGQFINYYQPYPDGSGLVQIGLKDCSYDGTAAAWTIGFPAHAEPQLFQVTSAVAFDVVFEATKNGDKSKQLFTVTATVTKVCALCSVAQGALSIDDVGVTLTTLTDDSGGAANAAAIGLSQKDLYKLEGLVEDAIAPTVIKNIFSGAPSINLSSLVPVLNFGAAPSLQLVGDGILIVAGDGNSVNDTRCPCAGPAVPVTSYAGPPVPSGTDAGSLPIKFIFPPVSPLPIENVYTPSICLYMPQVTIDAVTEGPYPSISGYVDDGGFVGYHFDYSMAFRNVSWSLTDPRAAIVVSLDIYFTGFGQVNVDVPCVGREVVGTVQAQDDAGSSLLKIGASPIVQPNGTIGLDVELLDISIAGFDVETWTLLADLIGFVASAATEVPGAGPLASFVFTAILNRLIANKLPGEISDAVKNSLGSLKWILLDLSKFEGLGSGLIHATIDRAPDSLLVGYEI